MNQGISIEVPTASIKVGGFGFVREMPANVVFGPDHRFFSCFAFNHGHNKKMTVHFHMLFVDGVYTTTPRGKNRFHRTNAPDQQELTELVRTISHRVARSATG